MKRGTSEVLKTTARTGFRISRFASPLVLVLTALVATIGGGCSKDEAHSSRRYRLPWPQENGEYALQDVQIQTYSDPTHFRGSVARILVEPSDRGGRLGGEDPVGRYVTTSSGSIVPADTVSLQATTIYAHMERLRAMDETLGAASSIRWPLTIGVQTNVYDGNSAVVNNAVYDGRLDALLVVPYRGSGLPIALNAGILAHEHFHSIFQTLVLSRLGEQGINVAHAHDHWVDRPSNREARADVRIAIENSATAAQTDEIPKTAFNSFLLRSVNEGFADFWGWVYSGDPSFIHPSLEREGRVRRMDIDSGRLLSSSDIRRNLYDPSRPDKMVPHVSRTELAYRIGTQYARFLRETANELAGGTTSTLESRLAVARLVIAALPDIANDAVRSYTTAYLSPNFILKPFILRMGELSAQTCERIARFKATADDNEPVPRACARHRESVPTPRRGGRERSALVQRPSAPFHVGER